MATKKNKVPEGPIRPNLRQGPPIALTEKGFDALSAAWKRGIDGRATLDWLIERAEAERNRLWIDRTKPIDPESPAQDAHEILVGALAAREALGVRRVSRAVAHSLWLGMRLAWVRTQAFEPLVATGRKVRAGAAAGGARRKVDPEVLAEEASDYRALIQEMAKPPHEMSRTRARRAIAKKLHVPYSRVLRLTKDSGNSSPPK